MQTRSNQSLSFTPLFSLGRVVATPGALARLAAENIPAVALLRRHVGGDWSTGICSRRFQHFHHPWWSDCGEDDAQVNRDALQNGGRILSLYYLDGSRQPDQRVWIITEADRSVTTLLLPEEY